MPVNVPRTKLFIGMMYDVDPKTGQDSPPVYAAVTVDPATRRALGAPSCANRLVDLIAQLKAVGRAKPPFTFDPPDPYQERYVVKRFEALTMNDFWKARNLLGLP